MPREASTIDYSLYKRIYISGERLDSLQVVLEDVLESCGSSVSYFPEHTQCLQELRQAPCDLLVIDVEDCPEEAIDVLTQAVREVPSMVILWVTEPPPSPAWSGWPCLE